MRLALAQTDIYWENKEKNKEVCLSFLSNARDRKADLILFPEMSLTGFSMNVSEIGEIPVDYDSSVQWFINQAINFKLNIGFGYVLRDSGSAKSKNNFLKYFR